MKIETEVAVVGAGPSGVCAAIAAARLGSKVVLIGDRPVLGGNSSSEIRVWTRGATGGGNIFAEEAGIWGELKLDNLYRNSQANPILWDEILLDHVLAEKNITLLLNTHITNLVMSNNSIHYICGFQLGSEKEYQIYSKFFIDSTGDATLGALSGLPYTVGTEAKSEYSEEFAPDKKDYNKLGSTIFFYTKKSDNKVDFIPPSYAYNLEYIENLIGTGGRVVNENYNACDYWWFEYGGTLDTIGASQEITLELKKIVMGVWNYIKNSGKFDADFLTLEWIGNIPGKRESRRMKTDYVLTQNDIMNHTEFYDGAFYGGWYLDYHPAEGLYTKDDNCTQIPVPIYEIPLRCLYNSNVENLLFAGRDIGTTHSAFASTRIMNTCALSGQAAGTLSNACINLNKAPNKLSKIEIMQLRQTLLREDMFILNCKNQDEKDLALTANVTASSIVKGNFANKDKRIPIKDETFLIVPSELKNFELLINGEQDNLINANLFISSVPSRYCFGKPMGSIQIKVLKGTNWCKVSLPEFKEQGFIIVKFKSNDTNQIITSQAGVTGVLGANKNMVAYWYPCIKFHENTLYSPQNIINGYNRPYKKPNLWISDAEENPEILLSWDKPQNISEIRLYFNPDFSKELVNSRPYVWSKHHKFVARTQMPEQLIKEYEVYTKTESGWVLIKKEKNNFKLVSSIKLENAINVTDLKFVFVSTYGSKSAEVFEIRVY